MIKRSYGVFAMITLSLSAPGFCESGTQSTIESRPMRASVDGMKAYYEPDNVKKSDDKVTFKIYSSPDPTAKGEGDEYSINCSTHEMSSREVSRGKREWSQPSALIAGESMYPLAKKLCDWGPGFWKKLMD